MDQWLVVNRPYILLCLHLQAKQDKINGQDIQKFRTIKGSKKKGEGACTRIGKTTRENPDQNTTYKQMSIQTHFIPQENTIPKPR